MRAQAEGSDADDGMQDLRSNDAQRFRNARTSISNNPHQESEDGRDPEPPEGDDEGYAVEGEPDGVGRGARSGGEELVREGRSVVDAGHGEGRLVKRRADWVSVASRGCEEQRQGAAEQTSERAIRKDGRRSSLLLWLCATRLDDAGPSAGFRRRSNGRGSRAVEGRVNMTWSVF